MMQEVIDFARACRAEFPFTPGVVLEFGSLNINGTIRDAFADAETYIGVDQQAGPGVDIVSTFDVFSPCISSERFDTILCCDTLEHDRAPWRSIAEMRRMLKAGGYMFASTPPYEFGVHRHPKDYWRFGEDAFVEVLFEGFDILKMAVVTDKAGAPTRCALGRKRWPQIVRV